MHPLMNQAMASEHRKDLVRAATQQREARQRTAGEPSERTALAAQLGWILIRAGSRLVDDRPGAPVVHPARPC